MWIFVVLQVVDLGLQGGDHRETRVIKSLLALPMLPVREITPVFHAIREYVHRQRHAVLLDLCQYFVGLWLKDSQGRAKWEPAKWSVYRQTVRTNNDAEGWHRRLNARARHSKLNVYRLIELFHHDAQLLPVQVNTETIFPIS